MPLAPLSPQQLQEVYGWLGHLNLQKTSNQLHRDFADAVLAARVVSTFLPGAVELHSY